MMKTTEQKRAQAQRIVNLIDTRGDWVNRLYRFTKKALADDNLRSEISWSAFCEARSYDLNDNTYLTINEYLDAWCGSVEEEEAFINAGVEPY